MLDRVLANSRFYERSRRMIGAYREMELLLERVARLQPGDRVMDFGCGNGRLARMISDVTYVGIDNNPSYIAAAKEEFPQSNIEFICSDVADLHKKDLEPFDAVISIGVLHHIPDEVAHSAIAASLRMLKPGGRMITMDPVFEESQSSVARVLMALDRGRFVRHPNDYRRLAEDSGAVVDSQELWTDVYRFPYTHCVQVLRPAE